jgi:hypothetical protein
MDASYHDQLEALFYFHPLQAKYYDQIVDNVDRYGQPVIHEENGRLSIRLDRTVSTECLFAFYGPKLAGVVVHTVVCEKLILIHLAIDPIFLTDEYPSDFNLTQMLIKETLNYRADPAIQTVEIPYRNFMLPAAMFGK